MPSVEIQVLHFLPSVSLLAQVPTCRSILASIVLLIPSFPRFLPLRALRLLKLTLLGLFLAFQPSAPAQSLVSLQLPFDYLVSCPVGGRKADHWDIKVVPNFDPRLGTVNALSLTQLYTNSFGSATITNPAPMSDFYSYQDTLAFSLPMFNWQTTAVGAGRMLNRAGNIGPNQSVGVTFGSSSLSGFPTSVFAQNPSLFNQAANGLDYVMTSSVSIHLETVAGTWNVEIGGYYNRSYISRPTTDYYVEALTLAKQQYPGASDGEIAQRSYEDLISLRQTDPATSSQNIELQHAEYFLRGYRGATVLLNPLLYPLDYTNLMNEIGDRGGPNSLLIYNGIKTVKNFFNHNISGDGNLPAAPVGGGDANLDGYLRGLRFDSVDQLISNPSNLDLHQAPSKLPTQGLKPLSSTNVHVESDTYTTNNFYFKESADGSLEYFDPEASTLYAWSVFGNRFKRLGIPVEFANAIHLDLGFLSYEVDVTGLTTFDFTSYAPEGVDSFLFEVTTDGAAIAEPNFGFAFTTVGDTMLNVTTVPEPGSMLLLMYCLLPLCCASRLRRKGGSSGPLLPKSEFTVSSPAGPLFSSASPRAGA